MTPETFFKLANGLAMIGWIILIFLPRYRSDKLILGIFITLLSIVYTYLVFTEFTFADLKGFGSLHGVMTLFQNPGVLLAGWVHYLAFDLMVGLWIKNNAIKHRINHWYIVPCLFFTFLLGPVGLLLYLVIRIFVTRKYFSENFSL
jgi:hypothetical protein